MEEQATFTLERTWKAFLLEQVNHPKSRRDDWAAWEDPDFDARDLPPHEAARSVLERNGRDAFERYHRALFQAHHEQERDLTDTATLVEVAESLDLPADPLETDLREGRYRSDVGADHREAEEEHGIFGVPTLLFNGTQPVFLKLDGGEWEGSDDVELFESIYRTAATRPHLLTLKKPASASGQPPAPDVDFNQGKTDES